MLLTVELGNILQSFLFFFFLFTTVPILNTCLVFMELKFILKLWQNNTNSRSGHIYIRHSNFSGNLTWPSSSSCSILSRLLLTIILELPFTSLLCLEPLFPGAHIFSLFWCITLGKSTWEVTFFLRPSISENAFILLLYLSDGLTEYKIISWK